MNRNTIFSPPSLTRSVQRLYSNLLQMPCLLCGDKCVQMPVCEACQRDLPVLTGGCPRCAIPLARAGLCGQCQQHPPPQDATCSAFAYQFPVDQLITAYKFRHQQSLTRLFATRLLAKVRQQPVLPSMLIPIPLHPRRLRQRGFNQAMEITRELSHALDCGISHDLKRIRHTQPQSSLDHHARRRNIRNAFHWDGPSPHTHVAIIDDVYTSGHTTAEAAKILKKAGAQHVDIWTIARAVRHD